MPGLAAKVTITERQKEVFQSMVWSRSCPQGLAHRAEIILLAFEGFKNEVIAERLGCERHGVGLWRRRWKKAFEQLIVIECVEKPAALRDAIEDVLGDLPRAGCGGKFTAEQIAQIMAVACEPPDQSGRTVSHWTPRKLADEAVKRGIVPSISVRHVGTNKHFAELRAPIGRVDVPPGQVVGISTGADAGLARRRAFWVISCPHDPPPPGASTIRRHPR